MTLDISALINAINRLDEGIKRYQLDICDEQIRDGLIQRFEFTYELSHKMLKRHLEMTAATPEDIDTFAFQTIIRTANEQGLLLSDWAVWRGFREMRGKTSHTYNENIALQVVDQIPAFLSEAEYLRDKLLERIAKN